MKASDVYAKSNNPFVPKTNFEGAFPAVHDVIVTVTEYDEYNQSSRRKYDKNNLGQFINCSNRQCFNGGFAIGDALFRLSFRKETYGEGEATCQGHDGNSKRRGDSCDHRFTYTISIVYKAEEKQKDNGESEKGSADERTSN